MSYLSYMNDDEENKNQNGINTSGVVDGVAGAGSASGAQEQQAKTPGTGFTNLGQYLSQNQGVGAGLAQKATADVSNAADAYTTQAAQTVNDAKTGFDNTAQAAKTKSNALQAGIGYDATANLGQAKDFLGSSYGGPTASAYTTGLASQKDQLAGDLAKVDDTAVQQANLAKAYGQNGNYTQGYGLLDSFLMNGDASGRQQLDAVKAKANDITKTYNTTADTLKAQEDAARKAVDDSKKDLVSAAATEKNHRDQAALYQSSMKNKQYANQVRDGFTPASYGDVLTDDNIADIQALTELGGLTEFNPSQYNRTFNEGQFVKNQAPTPDLSSLKSLDWLSGNPPPSQPKAAPPKPTVNVPAGESDKLKKKDSKR